MIQVDNAAPTKSELPYRYRHILAEVEKLAIFAYGLSQDKRFYQDCQISQS